MKQTKSFSASSISWMKKAVWGPLKWKELHFRAISRLPIDDEKEWFDSFVEGVPCPECKEHFNKFIEDHPPNFTSRESMFEWTVEAHNYVNYMTGKQWMSSIEAAKLYVDQVI